MKFIQSIKMFLKSQPTSIKIGLWMALGFLLVSFGVYVSRSNDAPEQKAAEPEPEVFAKVKKPKFVKGVHLTSWVAGSKKARARINALLEETELNTVVIAIKEYQGDVYIPGVPVAAKHKLFVNAIPDVKEYIAQLKKNGIYTIARIVVFKDNALSRKKTEWAVKRSDGSLWADRAKNGWVDPYNKEVWEYNFSVATQAIALGFEEIQFDYIRFPSDGDIKECRYSYAQHNSSSSAKAIESFLEEASKRLKPYGVNLSIDVFGLTPSVKHDMGIGQKIVTMTQWMDYVSPMVYPSHYAKGEYGITNPNSEPYRVVSRTMSDAKKRLGENYTRLRPYLQDFSLGYKYGAKEVRAQISACEELGINEWLLWNPNCQYTRAALRSKKEESAGEARIPKSAPGEQRPEDNVDKKDKPKEEKSENLSTSVEPNLQADSVKVKDSSPTQPSTQPQTE